MFTRRLTGSALVALLILCALAPLDAHAKPPRKAPDQSRGWRVRKAPVISGFSPRMGGGGTRVTINGQHLGQTSVIKFNGKVLRVTKRSPTSITVVIPRGAATDEFVIRKPGFAEVTSSARFEVLKKPSLRGFSPAGGDAGVTITIEGDNFVSIDKFFIGKREMRVKRLEPRRVRAVVPAGASSGRIRIVRSGRQVAASRKFFSVALAQPSIDSFSPERGSAGTVVRISGSNFDPRDRVMLGRRPLRVMSRGADFLQVKIPRGVRSGSFVVAGRGGRRGSSSRSFVVIQPPKVRGFEPKAGPAGTQITIRGVGFTQGDEVYIGDGQLTIRTLSDTQIVAQLPAGVAGGRLYVKRGTRKYFAPGRGTFRAVAAPTITGISPGAGPVGAKVTIRGSFIGRKARVFLAGKPTRVVRRKPPHEIVIKIPAGGRSGRLTVVTSGGSAQSAANFRVQSPAVLRSFFPLSGSPGTKVKLEGESFHEGMRVYLGKTPLPVVSVTNGRAVVRIPPGARSGRVRLESWGKKSSPRLVFKVTEPPPELSFRFAPLKVKRGDEVTIFVRPARQGVTIFFNDRPLPSRTFGGGQRHVVTIPADARSGYLEVSYRGRQYRAKKKLRVRR
ncbi:MAG: IPT/TIG domain-containing protein [Myxococcales bacterium]|nr:IPT/TIG domain-containing protein [Myxococcales bacterium]